MAWDEWERLKDQAAEQHSTRMRLNHVPPEPSVSTQGDLRVDQQDLAAVGDAAFRLHRDVDRFSDHARVASQKAASGLTSEGYALGGALNHVAARWVDQVQSLLDATAHISNHLDYSRGAHAGDEVFVAGTLSSISTLDSGFDERTAR
ncbi:hypothetical protein OG233_19855 [Streptomyces sp. NBC_01218]|uniref:hypothetical protein n=1 Tax=Streptomyces sp. NBC_01218 TaxID=2903780 RepID=UPI002E11DC2A|nr:hypothetical protein OG233_19855 [Streptomyces sp. NBC_01218]